MTFQWLDKERILKLKAEGLTHQAIASRFGVSVGCIRGVLGDNEKRRLKRKPVCRPERLVG